MTRFASALLCAPLLLAVPAQAEDAPQRTDIIVTANADPRPQPQPGASDSIPAAELADRTTVSLRDALALSPGVIAQPRYGQEIRLSIRGSGLSRGYHLRGITLLQDGVPVNEADGEADFMEIDPRVLDRLDVVRGANAMAFGIASLGGAVNAVTPTGDSARGLAASVEGGSWDTLRGLARYGHADARGDAFVALSADRSDGDREHARRSAVRFNGNVGLHLTDTIDTRFYASAQRVRQDLPGALTIAQARDDPRQAAAAALAGDQARDVDSLRLQNRTTARFGAVTAEVGGFFASKALNHPIFQVIDQQSNTGGFYARIDWGQGPLALRAGTIARFGGTASRRFVNVAGAKGALTFDADQRARTIDSYGEARVTPFAALTLIAGVDWEGGVRRQTIAVPARAVGRVAYDQLSPRFGAVARVAPGVELYANYSRSHELPGFTELAQISTFVPLAPQRGWTAEAGLRGGWGPARFDLTAYRADLRGELLQYTVSQSIPASTFNADRTRHQGIEASLDLALARWATLRQSYTYSDLTFRDDATYGANRLPVIPRHYYHGELRIGANGYALVPRVEWVPQGAWVDYRNTVRVPGYAMLGLGAEAPLGRAASVFVDARNLTARHAIGDVSAAILASPATQLAYPVERRAVYVGLRAGF